MTKSKKRKRKNKQTSFVGALLIETIAFVVMLGLFFAVQKERANMPTVDELVRPAMIEMIQPYQGASWSASLGPNQKASEAESLAASEKRVIKWRDPFGFRR